LGSAIIPVPEFWRDVVNASAIPWNLDDIRDAVRPNITRETIASPLRLLYRHSFVHLFNHLERIGDLLQTSAISVSDLGPLTWLVKELTSWRYALPEERDSFFISALNAWYPNGVPKGLLDKVSSKFTKDIQKA